MGKLTDLALLAARAATESLERLLDPDSPTRDGLEWRVRRLQEQHDQDLQRIDELLDELDGAQVPFLSSEEAQAIEEGIAELAEHSHHGSYDGEISSLEGLLARCTVKSGPQELLYCDSCNASSSKDLTVGNRGGNGTFCDDCYGRLHRTTPL